MKLSISKAKNADALSRIEKQAELFNLVSGSVSNELMDAVMTTWSSDEGLHKTVEGLKNKTLTVTKYAWVNDQLLRKGKWVVGNNETLRNQLIAHFHNSAVGGHSGVHATTKRITAFFYWKGLRKMVTFVKETSQIYLHTLVYFNHYPYHTEFGKRYQWIL